MRPRIDIVTMAVQDLDVATRFYKTIFGIADDGVSEGEGHVALFLDDGMSLVLYEIEAFAEMTGQEASDIKGHSMMLSHNTRNYGRVDTIISEASGAGGTVIQEGRENGWGYSGMFKDIDGYTWEIMSGE